MLQRILHGHPRSLPNGETIERVRMHEIATEIAFLGRRRRVYTRLVALSGAQPGDRVLDVGCSGGYLARLLAAAAGFHVEARGNLPLLRYVRAARPDDTKLTPLRSDF
jgi:protein-L-isoaspartate O-methyltransferase